MAQTKAGGKKVIETMIRKYGGPAGYKAHMQEIGARGGSSKYNSPKGFAAMTPEKRSAAGRIGGKISRRNKVIY